MQVRLPARRRWPCPRAARQGSPRGGRGGGESARAPRAGCEGRKGGGRSGTQARGAARSACSTPAPLDQAAASARRALRPQRPPEPSRDRRGRRPGRGRGRGAGLPAAPGAAGPSLPGAPSPRRSVCSPRPSGSALLRGPPFGARKPRKRERGQSGEWRGLWVSRDPQHTNNPLPVCASSGLLEPFGVRGIQV